MTESLWVLVAILGYVGVQLLIGAWVGRTIRSEEDYLVAGRSLGYPLVIFTMMATWFGAETVIGAAGSVYEEGLGGGTADPFGYALCILLLGAFFARRIWDMKLTTPADFFRMRFGPQVEKVAILLWVPTSLLWAAAQIRAFGQVLSVAGGVDLDLMILLAALIVIAYTTMGGLLADVWTDLIQGIALAAGLVILLTVVLMNGGSEHLSDIALAPLDLVRGHGSVWGTLEAWAIPVCGSLFAAELLTRVMAARSATVARRGALAAGALYLAVGCIPVTLGLLGPHLMPGLESPEQLIPTLSRAMMGPVLFTLMAGALVSAILSTVDSALLVSASVVSHNLIVPRLNAPSERTKVLVARTGVACFGVLAYAMATQADSVYGLVEEASAFGSSGIFVVMCVGLSSRAGGARAGLMSLLAGVLFWVLGAYVLELDHPFLTSLAAALLGYLTGGVLDARLDSAKSG